MLQFKSNVIGGFPFTVNTTSHLSPVMKTKFQRAVNIASDRLREDNLKEFIENYYHKKVYTKGWWLWRRVVRTESREGFHVDTKSDIFNTSKAEILHTILAGKELNLGESADGEADVFWRLDNRNKAGVIGYTYRSTIWQYTYKNWAESMSVEVLAGHLVHEWLHKLGGEHAHKGHSLRKHTATYAIGYYVSGKFRR